MKDNSNVNDIIFSISKPQTAYYSERKVMSYSPMNNSEQMNEYILENRPKYITISIFEPHPSWTFEWITLSSQENFTYPIFAQFADQNRMQPTIIVYGLNLPSEESCSNKTATCAVTPL